MVDRREFRRAVRARVSKPGSARQWCSAVMLTPFADAICRVAIRRIACRRVLRTPRPTPRLAQQRAQTRELGFEFCTDADIDAVFSLLDDDNSGTIDFRELNMQLRPSTVARNRFKLRKRAGTSVRIQQQAASDNLQAAKSQVSVRSRRESKHKPPTSETRTLPHARKATGSLWRCCCRCCCRMCRCRCDR